MQNWKEIIIKRTCILRKKLENINSNRQKLEFLKNYYLNKTAIIVGTGPEYKDNIEIIKNNINENTILICLKQSIKDFDMICDFHVYNGDHYENYAYGDFKPIVFYMNYSKPNIDNIRTVHQKADLNFFLFNLNGVIHNKTSIISEIQKNENRELLYWNDNNLGINENVVPHAQHIIFEIGFPLAINIGCKNIITNGWVGGSNHGCDIKNEVSWDNPKYNYLYTEQEKEYEYSKKLSKYLYDLYNVHIYALKTTNYQITTINYDDFINIVNNKNENIVDINNLVLEKLDKCINLLDKIEQM
jgi:hypothetical protein